MTLEWIAVPRLDYSLIFGTTSANYHVCVHMFARGRCSITTGQVYLDLNGNNAPDPSEPAALTDATGRYSFVTLTAGSYNVAEVLPAGWSVSLHGNAAARTRQLLD